MNQINLDSMYTVACLRKTDEVTGLDEILDFINLIQQVTIEEKYLPFEKPFVKLDERLDVMSETNNIPIEEGFVVINKVI